MRKEVNDVLGEALALSIKRTITICDLKYDCMCVELPQRDRQQVIWLKGRGGDQSNFFFFLQLRRRRDPVGLGIRRFSLSA